MASRTRTANEAWEALFRAQATIARELTDADVWDALSPREYGVLYALSATPDGLRMTELLDDVLRAGLTRRAPRTIIAPGLLHAELARIRERGVAYEREESGVGVTCVAAPVLDADGRALAALSITGWVNRFDAERLAPAVRTAALGLTRALAVVR